MPAKSQVFWDLLALASLFGFVVVIVWIHLSSPLLTSSAPFSNGELNEISIAVAIGATAYTMFITDRIRHGFIRSLESDLCNIAADTDSQANAYKIRNLERTWRSVLRIDVWRERCAHLPSFWIFLRYVATGLLTASVITTFTPRLGTRYATYDLLIPGTDYPVFSEPVPAENMPCTFMLDPNVTFPGGRATMWPTFENGSTVFTVLTGSPCPSTDVVQLVNGINSDNADEYAYVDSGIAVQRSAMGASRNIFNSPKFSDLVTKYGPSLNSTTQCVPVMTSNPVKCNRDDKTRLEVKDESHLEMVLDGVGPSFEFTYAGRNLSRDNIMANSLMLYTPDADAGPEDIGLAYIEWSGYTGDPNATSSGANDLAHMMGEQDKSIGLAQGSSYAVQCFIEPHNSFEYRFVTLLLNYAPANTNNHTGATRLGYTRSLIGGEPCTPATGAIGLPHFAAVVASQEKMVNEQRGTDNYFNTIQRVASRWGRVGPPFAFLDSRNALEDALGVIAALGVSTLAATEDDGNNSIIPTALVPQGKGKDAKNTTSLPMAAINVSGFSSTPLVLCLVLIPPVITFAILMEMFLRSFRPGWQPGGGRHGMMLPGFPQEKKQPTMFVAESLTALIRLGGRVSMTPRSGTLVNMHVATRSTVAASSLQGRPKSSGTNNTSENGSGTPVPALVHRSTTL